MQRQDHVEFLSTNYLNYKGQRKHYTYICLKVTTINCPIRPSVHSGSVPSFGPNITLVHTPLRVNSQVGAYEVLRKSVTGTTDPDLPSQTSTTTELRL